MPRERYNTKQKQIILDYLSANSGKHIKVAQIFDDLNSDGINIGISTVYRCLDKLVLSGEVKRYILNGNDGACYQYGFEQDDVHSEYHLRCSECGELFHFKSDRLNQVSEDLNSEDISINLNNTVFSGVCKSCNKK